MTTRARICWLAAALVILGASPAAARAETFLNAQQISIPGTYIGPATPFPSNIGVDGLSGTVAKVTVLLIDVEAGGNADKLDLVLRGPDGQAVMLWSNACGNGGIAAMTRPEIGFDDAAPSAIPDAGPCPPGTYRPANYIGLGANPDDLSPAGGPAPPYGGQLSAFNGSSPNGSWSLFAFSDQSDDFFTIGAWALTLSIQPPAPPGTSPPGDTGQRAAALKRCKRKHGRARKRCRKRAEKLPL